MHDNQLWLKSEGPTLNQQVPAHKYQILFSISVRELLAGTGHDPKQHVESCVKKWSQVKCF